MRAEPSAAQIRDQLSRLLAHNSFRDSPTLQRLLSYIVEETLSGNGKDLKEYTLGVSVFKRGNDFDSRTDSIARVQVGVLRKKLAAYYSSSGQLDEIIIDIPRGQYVAQFNTREHNIPPIAVPEVAADHPRRAGFRELAWALLGIAVGLALWLPFKIRENVPPQQAAIFPWRDHPLWKGYFETDSSTQLVVGAPMFFAFGGIYARDSSVNTPEDLSQSETMRKVADLLRTTPRQEEIYTGLGETAGLYTLGRFFNSGGKDLPLTRNRLTRWQDFTHSNVILLSSFRFRTLSQQLNLPHEFEFDMKKSLIRNLHPTKEEQPTYRPSMTGSDSGFDYGLVSVWPSPQSGRRIMTIGGAYTWGTQGAADYVTDPPSLRDLAARLDADRPAEGNGGLQILLKILVKDSQPIATSYVTHRWLAKAKR